MERTMVHVNKKSRLEGFENGMQEKWCKDGLYIKLNSIDTYEDISEVITSRFLSFTNVLSYVKYHGCEIYENGVYRGRGCYSRSFLKDGEYCMSILDCLEVAFINDAFNFDEVVSAVKSVTGLDLSGYIGMCLCVDAITHNADRHLRNLSVVKSYNKDDGLSYRVAPLYDFGLGLFSDIAVYPRSADFYKNACEMPSKPFCSAFDEQLVVCNVNPIKIDINGLESTYSEYEDLNERYAIEVLKYGLDYYYGLAWVEV